ncbi:MAG TPA: copper-binding protein [Burkholderiaceae bacterium]|nr:copper-binding protein [Burkholderiaceae bacterium]HQR69866.1 copper-binding protein [Burkholderiaceae bacterium]
MTTKWFAAVLFGLAMALPAYAQSAPQGHGAPAAKGASTEMYSGEVKRINKDTGRVTLAHGPLTGFGMPAMTMAFAVKDPKQLATLKQGDKVRFALEQSGENLVVTRIEPVK